MKKVLIPLCIACMAITITSCGSSREAASLSTLNGEWNIIEINGSAVNVPPAGQSTPYIGFETSTGRVSGNSGCNRMMGSFDMNARPGTLDLSNIASTRMMCNDMTTETNVLNALKNVRGYRVVSVDRVALTNSLNRPIMVLTKRTSNQQLSNLDGEWKVTEAAGIAVPTGLEKQPYIVFDTASRRIHGNAGCNMINGSYTLDENNANAIAFPAVAATMMACPDMQIERRVLDGLNNAKSYRVLSDGSVELYNESGVTLMKLSK